MIPSSENLLGDGMLNRDGELWKTVRLFVTRARPVEADSTNTVATRDRSPVLLQRSSKGTGVVR